VGGLLLLRGPYLPLFLTMIVCNFVIPFPMLCLKRVRRSVPLILRAAASILIGCTPSAS